MLRRGKYPVNYESPTEIVLFFCIFSIDMNALTGKEYVWNVSTIHRYVSIIHQYFSRREFISIEKCSPKKPKPRRGFTLVLY
jgi:hypothetical protein